MTMAGSSKASSSKLIQQPPSDSEDELADENEYSTDEYPEEVTDEEEDEDDEDIAASSSSRPSTKASSSTSANHLDPSLFKSFFSSSPASRPSLKSALKTSRSGPITAETIEEARAIRRARLEAKLAAQRSKDRKGGIVRGRDGQEMKRLKDGRTVVRSLASYQDERPIVKSEQMVGGDEIAPEVIRLPLREAIEGQDQGERLASKKSSRYLQRKLGKTGSSSLNPQNDDSRSNGKRKASSNYKSEDDPLGLNDPAFMPGGEFAHLKGLTGKKSRRGKGDESGEDGGSSRSRKRKLTKKDLRGDALRTSVGSKKRSGGPALAFARAAGR